MKIDPSEYPLHLGSTVGANRRFTAYVAAANVHFQIGKWNRIVWQKLRRNLTLSPEIKCLCIPIFICIVPFDETMAKGVDVLARDTQHLSPQVQAQLTRQELLKACQGNDREAREVRNDLQFQSDIKSSSIKSE
jgi:hypothetical protein